MPAWGQLGMQAAGQITGALMGLALQGGQDRRQLRQQQKLQELEIAGQKQMTDYNTQKQMEMWRNTNYPAQLAMMKAAGLNPALMYGSPGPGGSTQIAQGNVSGADAPKGGGEALGMMMQGANYALQAAQIENIKAQTEKTKAEIPKTEAETKSLIQGIENQKVQAELIDAQRYATNIISDINARSSNSQVQSAARRLEAETEEVKKMMRENGINDATITDKIQQIKAEAIGSLLRNKLTEGQTSETYAKINKMAADIIQNAQHLDQEQQKIEITKWVETVKANFPSIGNVLGRSLNDLIEHIVRAGTGDVRPPMYQPKN